MEQLHGRLILAMTDNVPLYLILGSGLCHGRFPASPGFPYCHIRNEVIQTLRGLSCLWFPLMKARTTVSLWELDPSCSHFRPNSAVYLFWQGVNERTFSPLHWVPPMRWGLWEAMQIPHWTKLTRVLALTSMQPAADRHSKTHTHSHHLKFHGKNIKVHMMTRKECCDKDECSKPPPPSLWSSQPHARPKGKVVYQPQRKKTLVT